MVKPIHRETAVGRGDQQNLTALPGAGDRYERAAKPPETEASLRRPHQTADPIRVLIVDDHPLFRRGLDLVLSREQGIEVVGEGGDGLEAVQQAGDLLPDVILMDIRMPRSNGIEACATITGTVPNAKTVMLTVSDEQEDLFGALDAGANGYLLKESDIYEITKAVRAVHRGDFPISPVMAAKLIGDVASLTRRQQQIPASRLTDREMEVLRLVARGLSNREIVKELLFSEDSVENHVRNIMEKLHLPSRTKAVVAASRIATRGSTPR